MQTLPEKLRLAAKIIEENLPWQYTGETLSGWHTPISTAYPSHFAHGDWEIRIKPIDFPPFPPGLSWHNPDNLTPDQVGEGYRLLVTSEVDGRFAGKCECWHRGSKPWDGYGPCANSKVKTYRLPASTPFPEATAPSALSRLGPEDITPGSVLRRFHWEPGIYIVPIIVGGDGIVRCYNSNNSIGTLFISFDQLFSDYEILRPGSSSYVPCYKPAP